VFAPGVGGESRTSEPHYWLHEGRSSNAEVDNLIESGQGATPIEVRITVSGTIFRNQICSTAGA